MQNFKKLEHDPKTDYIQVIMEGHMKLSESIKPISYLKAHAAEMIRDITDSGSTMVITQRGEAKAVLQDVKSFQDNQDTLSLLKILSISSANRTAGKVKSADKAFSDIRDKIQKAK
jgi:PHD/YefM family antitoxin component YafN of YafNO toxin-antitoxin module